MLKLSATGPIRVGMTYSPPPPESVPAGWYPDPEGRGQRYWDGSVWTEHIAPSSQPATVPVKQASAGDWIGGALLALLLPLIGLIAGIVYVAKGDERRQVGIVTIGLLYGVHRVDRDRVRVLVGRGLRLLTLRSRHLAWLHQRRAATMGERGPRQCEEARQGMTRQDAMGVKYGVPGDVPAISARSVSASGELELLIAARCRKREYGNPTASPRHRNG